MNPFLITRKFSKFRKDMGVATIASLLSFSISLALTPVMTHLYAPEDYGAFAVINNIATFMATAMLLSVPNALPMEHAWIKKERLIRALLHLTLFAFVLSLLGVFLFTLFCMVFCENESVVWLYWLLPFLVLSISLQRIVQSWANADGAFASMAAARVVHPLIAKPLAIVASLFAGSSPLYLVFFEMLGYIMQSYILVKKRIGQLNGVWRFFKRVNIKTTFGVVRKYSEYSIFLNFVNLLALGFITMQSVILSVNYSVKETGYFTLALSMASLPIQLVAMATASIVYHKLIQIQKSRPQELYKKTLSFIFGYMVLGSLPYGVLFFFGGDLFGFVFGENWAPSGAVASLLALPLYFNFVSMPITSAFRVTKSIKLQFMTDAVLLIPMVVGFYIVSLNIPFLAVLKLLAVAMTFYHLVTIVMVLYVTKYSTYRVKNSKKEFL